MYTVPNIVKLFLIALKVSNNMTMFEFNRRELNGTLWKAIKELPISEELETSVFTFLAIRERSILEQTIDSFIEGYGSRDILKFR